jgi:DNA-binding transcriptional regulator WhiA
MEDTLKKLYLEEGKQAKEIALILNKTTSQIEYALKKYCIQGLKGKNKSNIDESKLSSDNMILWYYIGLVAADGYIKLHKSGHYSIRLTIKNKGSHELLCKIADDLGYKNKIRQYKNGFNELEIVNRNLLSVLNACGIPNYNKTFDLTFPVNLTENQARMYIRGCFDGDGSVSIRTNSNWGGNFKMISASKSFIDGLSQELNKWLGVIKTPVISNNVYELILNIKDSMLVFDWMYKDNEDFRLAYKYDKYLSRKLYKESENYYSKNNNNILKINVNSIKS